MQPFSDNTMIASACVAAVGLALNRASKEFIKLRDTVNKVHHALFDDPEADPKRGLTQRMATTETKVSTLETRVGFIETRL